MSAREKRAVRPLRGSVPGAYRIASGQGRSGGDERPRVCGVEVSHPARVFFPDDGITKLELARYYATVGERMVPHLRGRPLTLVRCPESIRACAYMRHVKAWGPPPLRVVQVPEKAKLGEYLVADDEAAVIALVQMDILEIHTWSSLDRQLERPNRIVLDLDPDEGLPWARVTDGARLLQAMLQALELDSFVKTTGGKGLHVVVPLDAVSDWDTCLAFARALAERVERHDPRAYTASSVRARRAGRIYVDYLRNNRGNTSVCAFSTRARPGAPVSVPIAWDELSSPSVEEGWTVRTLPARLRRQRKDPWAAYARTRQRLTPAMLRALRG